MSIFIPVAQRSRAKLAVRGVVAGSVVMSTALAAVQPTLAAELVTAELVGTHNVVQVVQGQTADFTINLATAANSKLACGATATAKVKNAFSISSLSSGGTLSSGSTYSGTVSFTAPGSGNGNCDIAAGSGGTVNATIKADADAPLGRKTVLLQPNSTGTGTTVVTNSNTSGGKLEDETATTLTFEVIAPEVVNRAPASGSAPQPATGSEGSTLRTSGSFTDADGNLASITASSGTLTAAVDTAGKLTGSWAWELATNDDVSGSVTVTARDAAGLTATQTFNYSAGNVAPRRTASASDVNGLEGDTLAAGGAFEDVSGDSITITKTSGPGTVTDNGNGTWSWALQTTNEISDTVTVTASDGDGGTQTDVFTVEAANVAPGVATDAGDVAGDEGSPLGNAGAFSDRADTLTLSKEGDGTLTPGTANGAWGWRVSGADNARGLVTVTANDGTTSTDDAFNYTVRNVAPAVAAAAANASGDEGTTLETEGAFSDVSTDPLTITKVSGPGAVRDNGDGTWSWSFAATDDVNADSPAADRVVVVRASDGDGGTQDDSFDVAVRNLAPKVVGDGAENATGSEGNTLRTTGRFTDVPADTLTVTTTSTAGRLVDNGDGSWSWSLATSDQTNGTVTVTATDDNGGTVTDTFDYRAVDVAPQLTDAAVDAAGDEGETLTASGAFSDVAADRITVAKVSGPGTVTDLGNGSWSYSLATTDQISGTVVVRATDKDGVTSVADDFTVTARNVAPVAGPAPTAPTGAEGSTLRTSGSFTDVAADPLTIAKESGAGTVVDNRDGTWSWSLDTTDNDTGTVVIKADDGDGGITRSSFTHTANNVAPVLSDLALTGNTGTACLTGNTVGLKFTVADPGSADTMSGTIDWGDGTTEPFTSRSVDAAHSYKPGSFTITVNVSDDDGAAAPAKNAGVSRNYAIGAIQSPFNADGSSVFKYGSTVPVKVRITDCANVTVTTLAPTIRVGLASSTAPSTAINETVDSTSAADTTGVMRYDTTSSQYIYNMATKSLTDGDAKYVVKVADAGASVQQNFGLRTK